MSEKGQTESLDLVAATETHAREVMGRQSGDLMIAHDFKHVERVRRWALVIARGEGFADLQSVEVTALLHDIGLGQMPEGAERGDHAAIGSRLATEFLRGNSDLLLEQIDLVADAIRYHSAPPWTAKEHLQVLGARGKLAGILRDADNLDALGSVGLMRAFTSKHSLPDYDPANVTGEVQPSSESKERPITIRTIVDQINRQIRYYDNLHTATARELGTPLVEFMKGFLRQLEREIRHSGM